MVFLSFWFLLLLHWYGIAWFSLFYPILPAPFFSNLIVFPSRFPSFLIIICTPLLVFFSFANYCMSCHLFLRLVDLWSFLILIVISFCMLGISLLLMLFSFSCCLEIYFYTSFMKYIFYLLFTEGLVISAATKLLFPCGNSDSSWFYINCLLLFHNLLYFEVVFFFFWNTIFFLLQVFLLQTFNSSSNVFQHIILYNYCCLVFLLFPTCVVTLAATKWLTR